MLTRLRTPLRGSAPIVLVTALVAVLGIVGTAGATKLITGASIKDGSLTAADLSKKTRASLHGAKGIAGRKGDRGSRGALGVTGATGAVGAAGSNGAAGSDGAPGIAGTNGAAGASGSDGAPGLVGASGSPGTTGAAGANGTNGVDAIRYFAAIAADGTLSGTRVENVATASRIATGSYELQLTGALDFATCVAVAQVTEGVNTGARAGLPTANGNVAVSTTNTGGAAGDHAFVVMVAC